MAADFTIKIRNCAPLTINVKNRKAVDFQSVDGRTYIVTGLEQLLEKFPPGGLSVPADGTVTTAFAVHPCRFYAINADGAAGSQPCLKVKNPPQIIID